jgi:hypothetical protein
MLSEPMPIALNLTAPLKQDPGSKAALAQLKASFATHVQPAMDAALRESELVHFARVLVIDDRYLQVLTEFDGDPIVYTEFFRTELGDIFKQVFALIDGAPDWDDIDDETSFYEFTQTLNLPALGETTRDDVNRGYLFSAYDDLTVREIRGRARQ